MTAADVPHFDLTLSNAARSGDVRLRELRPWLTALLQELAPEYDGFAVQFTSDREIRRLNREFRSIDKATDVLSFPGEPGPEGRYLGDVVVSVPTARRQAAGAGHDVEREIRLLVLHGILHCLGHDHETDDGTMERVEAELRARWVDDD